MISNSQKVYIDHKILQGIDIVNPSFVLRVKLSQHDNDKMEKIKEEELWRNLEKLLDKWKSNGKTLQKTFFNNGESSENEESRRKK